ncbi:MAG: DUF4252 domain-containing protein [Bacteroidales bacterium]|nr:DUF4252 domain-containing protein [Bacteroidales bacterium]
MRKQILILFIILISSSSQAQVMNAFLDKYGKDENIIVVNIGKRMLDKMQSDSLATPELQKAIDGLESIRIVSSNDQEIIGAYYQSAYELVHKTKKFTEVLSIDHEDELLHILIKKTKEKVNELVLLSKDKKDFHFISLQGNIQLDVLAKYSENIGVKGLEKLNNIQ